MEIPGSPQLHQLALAALDYGVENAPDGPLIPFVVTEGAAHKRVLTRIAGDTLEGSVARAFDTARQSDAERIAVCFDGYVTLEGGRDDAIWVVAHERGDHAAITFYQRYHTAHSATGFEVIGNTGYAGENDPLLGCTGTE